MNPNFKAVDDATLLRRAIEMMLTQDLTHWDAQVDRVTIDALRVALEGELGADDGQQELTGPGFEAQARSWLGKSLEADFEADTWTFKIQPGFEVTAGLYRITPFLGAFVQPASIHAGFEVGPTGDNSVLAPRDPTAAILREALDSKRPDKACPDAIEISLADLSAILRKHLVADGHPLQQAKLNVHAGSEMGPDVSNSTKRPGASDEGSPP